MGQARDRFGLTPELRTFAVIDVILVVTFLVLVVLLRPFGGGGGEREGAAAPGSPSATGSSSPAPETSPDPSPAPATDTGTLRTFVLPSKNIWCEMSASSATCTILTFAYAAPAPPVDCQGTLGNVLTIEAGKPARMVCVEGEPQPVPEGAPTLEYGQASAVGAMTCHASTNGVTCLHNATGEGFAVARGGFLLF